MVTRVTPTYIDMIKAFRVNCDVLIGNFKSEENHDFRTFLKLWLSSNFNMIYDVKFSRHGMLHDFMHDTLQIAKLIMLHENFAGGMFLMYALYNLQENPLATIRLQLDEFQYILKHLRLKNESNVMKNYELALIFSTLLKEDVFDYVLFAREYDMEGQHRARIIYDNQYEFSDDESTIVKPENWVQSFQKDWPKEMKDLDSDYLKLKNQIKAVFPYLNLSLDMVKEDISTTLLNSLTQADSMAEPQKANTSIGARRRSLKQRKMKIKHRYSLDNDNSGENTESVPKNTESVPKKIKRKRGVPKGGRKLFFSQAINDPELNSNSNTEDEEDDLYLLDGKVSKSQISFPN